MNKYELTEQEIELLNKVLSKFLEDFIMRTNTEYENIISLSNKFKKENKDI